MYGNGPEVPAVRRDLPMNPTASEAPRAAETLLAFKRMSERLDGLEKMVVVLMTRLGPVLHEVGPEETMSQPGREFSSDLAQRIASDADRVQGFIVTLEKLIGRIEL